MQPVAAPSPLAEHSDEDGAGGEVPRRSGRLAHKGTKQEKGGASGCPGGHMLQKFVTVVEDWGCDKCEALQSAASTMWGCRVCDYDVCESCFEGEVPKGIKRKLEGPPKASAYNYFIGEQVSDGKSFNDGVVAWNALPESGRAKYHQIVRDRIEEWAKANGRTLGEDDFPKSKPSKAKCATTSVEDVTKSYASEELSDGPAPVFKTEVLEMMTAKKLKAPRVSSYEVFLEEQLKSGSTPQAALRAWMALPESEMPRYNRLAEERSAAHSLLRENAHKRLGIGKVKSAQKDLREDSASAPQGMRRKCAAPTVPRRLSAYNVYVGEVIGNGMTFQDATGSWLDLPDAEKAKYVQMAKETNEKTSSAREAQRVLDEAREAAEASAERDGIKPKLLHKGEDARAERAYEMPPSAQEPTFTTATSAPEASNAPAARRPADAAATLLASLADEVRETLLDLSLRTPQDLRIAAAALTTTANAMESIQAAWKQAAISQSFENEDA